MCCPCALGNVDPKQVDDAIERAKKWLYSRQSSGNWERPVGSGHGDQTSGSTALVVFALLTAGESHNDPRIQQAVEYLKSTDTNGVYALGLRCQVWALLPQTDDIKAAMQKDAKILLNSIQRSGRGAGFYGYNPDATPYSHSRGHYGVLGVWAAAQSGVKVPDAYWQLVEKSWIAHQDPSGGWTYQARDQTSHPLTPNMTASAVATLFITQDYLRANEGIACRGNIRNPAIEKGMQWLAENLNKVATDERLPRNYPYNTLYGIERVGVASGYKYIGDIDWFQHGAGWLLKNQKRDGSWPAEYGDVTSTSFALVFLARGRAPVAINKLDYAAASKDPRKPAPWNQRPRDVANAVRWIGGKSERELNWQIVNLNSPVNDLLDAPILFIAGNHALDFSEEVKTKLKEYIEAGGLVLGNADCQGRAFSLSFRKLGQELFPSYEFRELPAEHPVYTNQQFPRANWKQKPSVLSLSNGTRELMMLIPQADIAKAWQLQLSAAREEPWQLAANIFHYAIDKQNLRNKGESWIIARDTRIKTDKTIKLARLQYAGNWDPEPGGWRRLGNRLHNQHKTDLDVQAIKLAEDSLDGYKIAHLTGTTRISFDDDARKQLQGFIDVGGTLFIDAAGGSSEFAQSAETELTAMFPDMKLAPLEASHGLFKAGGSEMTSFRYRPFAQRVLGALKDAPRLTALVRDDRPIVIFSREDLSTGLVGQPVDGITGYAPETATEIGMKVVLFCGG